MKTLHLIAITLLFLLGIFEVALGLFGGRHFVKVVEGQIWTKVLKMGNQSSPEELLAFRDSIDRLSDQWRIVAIFGMLTIILAFVCLKGRRPTTKTFNTTEEETP